MARRKKTMASPPKEGQGKIPEFKDEIEAGEFWDTHSPLDFPGEFERVEVEFPRPLFTETFSVKFDEETVKQLRKVAKEMGIGPSTLVRIWVVERLKERKSAS